MSAADPADRRPDAQEPPTAAVDPARPVLLFDGECGTCRGWAALARRWTGSRVEYLAAEEARGRVAPLFLELCRDSVVLLDSDRVLSGAEAAFRLVALSGLPGAGVLLGAYRALPPVARASEAAYRVVARNRSRGPEGRFLLARWLFLRLLGLAYLAAFFSLWGQVEGLVGAEGILPAGEFLRDVAQREGAGRFLAAPTVFWLGAGDEALLAACGAGIALSFALIGGFAQRPALVLLWALYLSLAVAGQTFLAFQWDSLLLEAGFLSLFLAPRGLLPRLPASDPAPPRLGLFLLRFLLFKLVFLSGAAKLLGTDEAWRSLAALPTYFQTQPLPTALGWFAFHLPDLVHRAAAALTLGIEVVLPFFVFGPRRGRLLAFAGLASLHLLIAATGNFGFLSLLCLALCVLLLDDAAFRGLLPGRLVEGVLRRGAACERAPAPGARARLVAWPVAALVMAVSVVRGAERLRVELPAPASLRWVDRAVQPFRSINGYGLFAVVTPRRPEIVLEGSDDGKEWTPFVLRFKPGPIDRAPPFAGLHLPRLDWQLWYAALGGLPSHPWVVSLLDRLLEGSPGVVECFAPGRYTLQPPKRVRALAYEYHFSTPEERAAGGNWWRRELRAIYAQPRELPTPVAQQPR